MRIFFYILVFAFCMTAFSVTAHAQCSVCSKTALQMGEKPAQALNRGIIYLMLMPFAIVGLIGYRWWRGQKETDPNDQNMADS